MNEFEEISVRLNELGFVFNQPEFTQKDGFYICMDTYPYFVTYKKKWFYFKKIERFMVFYNDNKNK